MFFAQHGNAAKDRIHPTETSTDICVGFDIKQRPPKPRRYAEPSPLTRWYAALAGGGPSSPLFAAAGGARLAPQALPSAATRAYALRASGGGARVFTSSNCLVLLL